MKLCFEGAAQTVTGSQTILTHRGKSVMIDCGLYQGPKALRNLNWQEPKYVKQVEAIIVTHAHIDHCGLLPRWANWGWKGKVFCTKPTADLLSVMLIDAAHLQEEDARFANRTKHSHHDPALPLYTEQDARKVLTMLHPMDYNQWIKINENISFRFLRAGHILGSSIVQISYTVNDHSKVITFSGDLGGGHSDLLKEPRQVFESDEIVLESTYGDRNIDVSGREDRLAEIVNKVIHRGGTLLIPAFALGRSQDLLFSLHRLKSQNKIPNVPIYLDSPMANAVTSIYRNHLDELKLNSQNNQIEESLSTRYFTGVESPDDSMLLTMSTEPKIVLSASGMLQGGRVLHHLKNKLKDPKNGVLFVGFQGQETKGRLLIEGALSIRIHHQEIAVEAEIFHLNGYSAHADSKDLLTWLNGFTKKPARIFLNHGEIDSQNALAKKINEQFGIPVEIPMLHQEIEL